MAIDFVTDDVIDCGASDTLIPEGQSCTISVWIYPDTMGGNGAGRIVDRNIIFYNGGTNQLVFQCPGSTNLQRNTATNAIVTTGWQHALVTWDGSTTAANIHIYVGGSEASYVLTQNGASLTDNSANSLFIGNTNTFNRGFDGRITEVAIWDVVLTAPQIALLASSRIKGIPLQIQPSALKGYWAINDQESGSSADGDTIRDLSGNNNNGTGDNGANNTGLTFVAETVLSYPDTVTMVDDTP